LKILITGASGFIGTYLGQYLIAQGHEVIATMRSINEATMNALQGATFATIDVMDTANIALEAGIDAIVHTATANDIASKDAATGVLLSSIGTKNMLDLAVKYKIPKFICFSTFQVYGTELQGNITEQSPTLLVNDYGINHLFAEQYVEMYARQNKIQGMVVRPSNVYGEIKSKHINRWTLVPACFCLDAIKNGSITILSSGKQSRNFVSLENVSQSITVILNNYPAKYEIFNIASSVNYSIAYAAEMVKKVYQSIYNKNLTINILGNQPTEGNQFVVSLEKINKLGFQENHSKNLETEIKSIFNLLNQ
jgi:UDP-glucose 4-epimerase